MLTKKHKCMRLKGNNNNLGDDDVGDEDVGDEDVDEDVGDDETWWR